MPFWQEKRRQLYTDTKLTESGCLKAMNTPPVIYNEFTDVTELLRFAQDFYLTHPGQQMDLALWEKRVAQEGKPDDLWVVQVGKHAAEHARPSFIPVLAAITLGFGSEDLMTVMKHHRMTANDLLVCEYGLHLIPGVPENPVDDARTPLDSWSVCKEVVAAIYLDAELSKDLTEELNDLSVHYEHNYDFEIACLLSPNPDLWPITKLNTGLRSEDLSITACSTLQCASTSFCHLSNDQILLILERSGNLHPFVISENGFEEDQANQFYKDFFIGLLGRDTKNLTRVMEALNSVEDPVLLEKLNRRIINALPDFDFSGTQDAFEVMSMMEKHLNHDRYAPVLNSIVIKLNVLPINRMKLMPEFLASVQNVRAYELDREPDQILKRLNAELMAIEPEDFRRPHFHAIGAATKDLSRPQDLSGVDLQALLMRALQGFGEYGKAKHQTWMGEPTSKYVDNAKPSIENLARYVAKKAEVDYKAFADLSSEMKALLASNGFDPRKLPGISRQDKGRVLIDNLGL
jgi:hypothetical protein